MKTRTRITIVSVVFAFLAGIASAQRLTSQNDEKTIAKISNDLAMDKLAQAIRSHPEPLVREKLQGWYQAGSILLLGNNFLPTMNSSVESKNDGEQKVMLWFNVNFVLQMPGATGTADKQFLLWLILYHEAVHIDDHFSGRTRLLPLNPKGPVSDEGTARTTLWDMEWSAVSKEWALAKRFKKPYLVPVIDHYTRNGETPKTFLDGFYQLQMTGEAVRLNTALSTGFTSRYRQELAKLSAR